jgi:GNAT superfamily N-acetyltransferase
MIRTAVEPDLLGILDLYRQLHPDDPAMDRHAAGAAWSAILASDGMAIVVADAGGVLVSTCTLAIVANLTRGARPYGMIENVVTHDDYRRRGIGRAVLHHALGLAWRAGCYKVALATGSRRETTLQFYEGAGFQRGAKTYFEVRPPRATADD